MIASYINHGLSGTEYTEELLGCNIPEDLSCPRLRKRRLDRGYGTYSGSLHDVESGTTVRINRRSSSKLCVISKLIVCIVVLIASITGVHYGGTQMHAEQKLVKSAESDLEERCNWKVDCHGIVLPKYRTIYYTVNVSHCFEEECNNQNGEQICSEVPGCFWWEPRSYEEEIEYFNPITGDILEADLKSKISSGICDIHNDGDIEDPEACRVLEKSINPIRWNRNKWWILIGPSLISAALSFFKITAIIDSCHH
eukprot:NODE_215_length_14308_cov_0.330987.p7 type:complete len:254 gc:universal NODE_215_length_14308_cov_0.330987:7959-8720(+)